VAVGQFETSAGLEAVREKKRGKALRNDLPFAGREALADASELIDRFGDYALSEAAQRAHRSRALGNVVHFCRWRDAERMIATLSARESTGALH